MHLFRGPRKSLHGARPQDFSHSPAVITEQLGKLRPTPLAALGRQRLSSRSGCHPHPGTDIPLPSAGSSSRRLSLPPVRPPSLPSLQPVYLRMPGSPEVQENRARSSGNPALQPAVFQPAQARLGAANGRGVPPDHSQSEGSRLLGSRRGRARSPAPRGPSGTSGECEREQRVLAGIGWRLGVRGPDWPPRMDRCRVGLGWPSRAEFPARVGLPVGLDQSWCARANWLGKVCARLRGDNNKCGRMVRDTGR